MSQEFEFFQKTEGRNNLVLFVHGFRGGASTWENKNGSSFPRLLLTDEYIKDNFDVAVYEYFSVLTDLFAESKTKYRIIKDFILNRTSKKEKNLDINELSKNLNSLIRFSLGEYENIYIVAHSMGGLITKSLIINQFQNNDDTNVRLFVSLAVPHLGAEKATFGSIISSNLQIDNLRPVCEFIGKLNEKWIQLDNRPITKYVYGSYDEYVTETSAVAIELESKDVSSVAEDHNSISKPDSDTHLLVIAVCQFLKEACQHTELRDVGYQKLADDTLYDDELFVIKLIVAGIAPDVQLNVKELFLNAEYARKLLKSKYDKRKLEDLFENLQQLYRDSYDRHLAGGEINSGILLAEVHEKITSEDSRLLKSLIPALRVFHKKGMLHLLANSKEADVWWTKNKTISGR